jgi:hypothetical protein
MKHWTSPIVRAVVLVAGLFLLAIADGGYAHAQRDQVTDHRTPTARPGYVWVKDHWERVKAPTAKPVVPPPAVGPKPTRPSGPPVVTGGTEISRCRVDQAKCTAKCHTPLSLWQFSPGGPLTCSLICTDKYDACLKRGR